MSPQETAALCDFLDLFLDDRAAGRERSLPDYLRRYPGHEARIAAEYLALAAPETGEDARSAQGGADHVGPYRLLDVLGSGGQGRVFLAEDVRLGRRVAVKILEGGGMGLTAARVARLKREAATLSRLDHPRLCALLDVDLEGERPYLAMRYVPGETVAQRIHRSPMPTTSAEIGWAVSFVEQAARAVHAAHEAGIIHRDLKPGNIMIDRESAPVVLDFGLARDVADEGATITMAGEAFGTLAYMSPEQVSGSRTLDRRTDVYSLGVTLYEMLTSRRPVEAATRESLREAILHGDREHPQVLNRAIPRDLAVVLECATDPDVARRYSTALALAEDLRRVRGHEPILARPASVWTFGRRWAQRHPAAFAASAAGLALLVAGLVVTSILLARVTREQARTQREQDRLSALREAYVAQVIAADKPGVALGIAVRAALREPHPDIHNILYDLLDRCYEKHAISFRGGFVALGFEPVIDGRGRCWTGVGETVAAIELATGKIVPVAGTDAAARERRATAEPPYLAISADGKTVASAHADGMLRFWDAGESPALLDQRQVSGAAACWIDLAAATGRVLVAARDGTVGIHARDPTVAPVVLGPVDDAITMARFDPAGRRVVVTGFPAAAAAATGPPVTVFDAADGRVLARLGARGEVAHWADWSPDAASLVVASGRRAVLYRTSDWGEIASVEHRDVVRWAAFHPAGLRVATGSRDGIRVLDAASGAVVATSGEFRDRSVVRGAFSPDGTRLAVVAWDQTGSIVSCDDWREVRKLRGMGRPRALCWSLDGALLATIDEAVTVHAWYPGARPHLPVLAGHRGRVLSASYHPDGRRVLTASEDGAARVFDVASGAATVLVRHPGLSATHFLPGGARLLTIGDGTLSVWDAVAGARICEVRPSSARVTAAWPVDEARVVAACDDGVARIFDPRSGAVLNEVRVHEGPIVSGAVHAGRGLFATGGDDRTVRVVDVASGRVTRTLTWAPGEHGPSLSTLSSVFALCFDRTGDRLIAACEDQRQRAWDLGSGALAWEYTSWTPGLLAVDPAGRFLMTGAKWAGKVHFFDLDTLAGPKGLAAFHDTHMNSAIRFSPSGSFAVAASKDGSVRLWNMEATRPHAVFDGRCGILLDAAFSPDGRDVVLAGADGTARIWPVDPVQAAAAACPLDPAAFEGLENLVDQALLGR